ncbi:uncharacterized protein L201_000658 [Kwoniella dendrophila CBS 6074]|uniref:Tetratricopeptide repeat protein 1 n=1 Tax=Kwoniella dendrophila CBS 6074 TaxID=1295534 RepID=A0AAX4JLE6_9TREE
MSNEQTFEDLPTFDARKFEPPSWAKHEFHQWGNNDTNESKKNGESSRSAFNHDNGIEPTSKEEFNQHIDIADNDEEDEDIWEDAKEDLDLIEPDEAKFTNDELKGLLALGTKFKTEGNELFTSKPPKYDEAIKSYLKAIDHLPIIPNDKSSEETNEKNIIDQGEKQIFESTKKVESGIEEVTDEEAIKIEQEELNKSEEIIDLEKMEREEIEQDIKELTKATWGNLAACYIAIKDDKKAVEACTEALKIDPKYVKGLHRRATANERIGDLNALVSAKDDYTLLQTLLPNSSPILPSIRRSLFTLPERIKSKEKEQMDEMLGKLKDLGNSLLGNFGLSTDNFKFEKQENGGYGMSFQR